MSDYTPKVGDRVRATLGENVLVGIVEYADRAFAEVRVNDSLSLFPLYLSLGWQFERVVEVPTKFGAVIRRADGQVSANLLPHSVDNQPWATDAGDWVSTDEATDGGFTVLFEGVGE
ncbi:hypothetical protein Pan2_62 [Pseudanabaena phage Pan2]|nr:hypothetical protein Pan2_62 [Pseudanabaena phage Pan2]